MLIVGVALLFVATPLVIAFLENSNFPGELNETQLGFDGSTEIAFLDFPFLGMLFIALPVVILRKVRKYRL